MIGCVHKLAALLSARRQSKRAETRGISADQQRYDFDSFQSCGVRWTHRESARVRVTQQNERPRRKDVGYGEEVLAQGKV
jgi:hypothetical protein